MSEQRRIVTDEGLRRFAGYEMKRAFNAIQADVNAVLRPFGLRLLTFSALSVIAENPGLRQVELAAALSIEGSNAVSVIEALLEAGAIDRARPSGDRRSYALTPSAAGLALLERATEAVAAHDARMLQGIVGADRDALRRALRLIESRGPR